MEAAKRYLEKAGAGGISSNNDDESIPPEWSRTRFFESFIMKGLRLDLVQPGRIICSLTVPPRLLNAGNFLHGGATATLVDLVGSAVIFTVGSPVTGVSVEINVSYLDAAFVDEEIEIEAKVLRVGKAVGVASVELGRNLPEKSLPRAVTLNTLPFPVNCEQRETNRMSPPLCTSLWLFL